MVESFPAVTQVVELSDAIAHFSLGEPWNEANYRPCSLLIWNSSWIPYMIRALLCNFPPLLWSTVVVSPSIETAEHPLLGTIAMIALVDALETFERTSVASTGSSSLASIETA